MPANIIAFLLMELLEKLVKTFIIGTIHKWWCGMENRATVSSLKAHQKLDINFFPYE